MYPAVRQWTVSVAVLFVMRRKIGLYMPLANDRRAIGGHRQTDRLATDGFAIVPDVLSAADCEAIAAQVSSSVGASPGTRRLLERPWCRALAQRLHRHRLLAGLIPAGHIAVQCTYFAKSTAGNWLVPFHQDLSIPVAERVRSAGLHGWAMKEGVLFVQPPADLLHRLVAVRVHLDPCGPDDGPLRVIPGTQAQGRIEPAAVAAARAMATEVVCATDRGGVLVMKPLLLHASSKAAGTGKRRVLHFVFGPPELPLGLRWPHAL